MLSPDEIEKLVPAEEEKLRSPIPTRAISSDEFFPGKQTEKQKEFEKRVQLLGSELAKNRANPGDVSFKGRQAWQRHL